MWLLLLASPKRWVSEEWWSSSDDVLDGAGRRVAVFVVVVVERAAVDAAVLFVRGTRTTLVAPSRAPSNYESGRPQRRDGDGVRDGALRLGHGHARRRISRRRRLVGLASRGSLVVVAVRDDDRRLGHGVARGARDLGRDERHAVGFGKRDALA